MTAPAPAEPAATAVGGDRTGTGDGDREGGGRSGDADPAPTPDGASPWRWVPTLYFAQGLPYVAVMTLSVVLYKNLGVSNAEIAWATSWLYLPWVIKPLWSPLVELLGTRRRWVVVLQFAIGAALACVALTLPGPRAVQASLALFWLLAFASATHDIAADGFYLLALPQRTQAAFVGVRSTAYRASMIAGQGALVVLAGWLQSRGVAVAAAWAVVFGTLAAVFVAGAVWHARALPRPAGDAARPPASMASPVASRRLMAGFGQVFAAFFARRDIGRVLAFLLLYRFAEAQLLKLVVPFLLDAREAGGLALSTQAVGIVYGTVGVAALTAGGLLGGYVIARRGLKAMLWPLMLCMHVPNALFVALAAWQPQGLATVGAAIALEQFGYGFGFAAYLVFLLMVAGGADGRGPHKTAHYAIGTGFMALGMMVPGMWAGWLQQQLGYRDFFLWTCIAALPSLAAAAAVRIDPSFGLREDR